MIKTAGNRVFARLSSILNLPGTENLGKIDIGVAQPTYPLREVVESELIIPMMLYVDFSFDGMGSQTLDIPFDPYESDIGDADARQIIVSQAKGSQPVIVAGTTRIDRDWDAYMVDFGVTYETANIGATQTRLYQMFVTATSPPDPPQGVRPLWEGSGNDSFNGITSVVADHSDSSGRGFPIRMPNEAWLNAQTDRMFFSVTANPGQAEEGNASARILLCRKGVIPVFP